MLLLAGRLLPWIAAPITFQHSLQLRKEQRDHLHRWMRLYGRFLGHVLFGQEGDGSPSSTVLDPGSATRTPAIFARVLDWVFLPLLRLGLISPRECYDNAMLLSTVVAAVLLEAHKSQWRDERLRGPEPMSASMLSLLSPFNPVVLGCASSVLHTGQWWVQHVLRECTGYRVRPQTQILSPSGFPRQLRQMLYQHRLQLVQLPDCLADSDDEGTGLGDGNSSNNVIKLSVWARMHMMLERSPVDCVALLAEAESRVPGCAEVNMEIESVYVISFCICPSYVWMLICASLMGTFSVSAPPPLSVCVPMH